MELISVELLKEHPRNDEFFDDITGERWEEFLESIRTSGIIVPLVITQDYVVVSGNQRLRAAKKLGMKEVPCEIREYQDRDSISKEDLILKDLIETNLRQRGIGNLNPMKTARCILELERIYGIKHGGYRDNLQKLGCQVTPSGTCPQKTQRELSSDIGIGISRYQQIKKLNDLIPELQKFVEEGKLSSKAGEQLAYLDEDTQKQLLDVLGESINDMTLNEIKQIRYDTEKYKKQIADIQRKLIETETEKKKLEQAKNELEQKLKNIEPQIVEKVVEKIPDDYQTMKDTFNVIKQQAEQLNKKLAELEEEKRKLDEARKRALEEKRQAVEEKIKAEAELQNAKYELEQVKQQYGLEAKKQCELADKVLENIKEIIANTSSIIELMDIEQLPEYKINDFTTILVVFLDKLNRLYQQCERKAQNGKVAYFRKRSD